VAECSSSSALLDSFLGAHCLRNQAIQGQPRYNVGLGGAGTLLTIYLFGARCPAMNCLEEVKALLAIFCLAEAVGLLNVKL
jgi:hypothetical protein